MCTHDIIVTRTSRRAPPTNLGSSSTYQLYWDFIMPVVSVGMPLGPGCSTCGYCGPLGERSSTETSFKKAGFIASQLSCRVSTLWHKTHVILFSFSDSSPGLSKDDLPRVETIWNILLCSWSKTLVLSTVHYQVFCLWMCCETLLIWIRSQAWCDSI